MQARILGRAVGICALGICGVAFGIPGDLDCSFGGSGTGRVYTDFGGDTESLLNLHVRTDGKLLVSGLRVGSQSDQFVMARLLADGRLDTSFGDGGKALSSLSADSPAYLEAQALQSDGKILAVGTLTYPPSPPRADDFYLARFNADGTPDLGFASSGAIATDFAGGADYANAVAVQADGKILVAGGATDASGRPSVGLARYTAGGSLDTSFGSGGKLTTAISQPGTWDRSEAWSLAVQADGKILIGGLVSRYSSDGLQHTGAFLLARYNSTGVLDTGFGSQGVVVTEVGAGLDEIRVLQLAAGGKILVAGLTYDEASTATLGNEDWALARYNANGSLDDAFGLSGLAVKDWGGNYEEPAALLALGDGSLLVAGFSNNEDPQTHIVTGRSWIARYRADGSADLSFKSSPGAVSDARYRRLALLQDGRVLAGGSGPGNDNFLLSRILMNPEPSPQCAADEERSARENGGGGGGALNWLSLVVLMLAAGLRRKFRR